MTSERDKFEGDERVTKAYRELGAEKTPESLNQTIIEMAAQDAQQAGARNTLSAVWMKPLAWAATIGLSLAIVLELTQVPTTTIRYDAPPGENRSAITKDEVADDVEVFRRESKRKMEVIAAPAPMAASAGLAEEKEADVAESCDAQAQLSADDWMACIEDLRQAGAAEAADREYEAFILKYPSNPEN